MARQQRPPLYCGMRPHYISLQFQGRNSRTRLDCRGGCTASQDLHPFLYRHPKPKPTGTITSDNIEMLCLSVTFIETEREFTKRSEERRVGKECRSRWSP